jgi:hypothetical protein
MVMLRGEYPKCGNTIGDLNLREYMGKQVGGRFAGQLVAWMVVHGCCTVPLLHLTLSSTRRGRKKKRGLCTGVGVGVQGATIIAATPISHFKSLPWH